MTKQLVRLLISQKYDVNGKTKNGLTPLYIAIMNQQIYKIKKLLKAGADPLIPNLRGTYPIHYALNTSDVNVEIIRLLLENNKKQIYLEDAANNKVTALELVMLPSIIQGFPISQELAELFLNHGADINFQDRIGNTFLHYAVVYKNQAAIQFLLEHGASSDQKSTET